MRIFMLCAMVVLSISQRAEAICDSEVLLVMIGDSITAQLGYSDVVEAEFPLGEAITTAVPGETSRGFLPTGPLYQSFEYDLIQPCSVAILLGTNDTFFEGRPPSLFDVNMRLIVSELFVDGAESIFLMTPPQAFASAPIHQSRIAGYADRIRAFCAESESDDVHCGPDVHELLEPGDFSDTIHPNNIGHQKIADALIPMVVPEPEGAAPVALCVAILIALSKRARARSSS